NTPTNTPVPPTSTPTNTPVPPTNTPTFTPVPPTSTPTNTPLPTATPTPGLGWWDCSYLYRDPITVTAGSAAVPSGYSVSLSFNHAALVTGGKSLASGNDIRVLYWNGLSWVELDRFLDPGSAWNSASTTIWLQTQAAIGATSSDSDYYIYYGNSGAGAPPANPSSIFFFYDGFESGDFIAWDVTSTGPGDSLTVVTTTVHTGTYAAEADTNVPDDNYARVENNFTGQQAFHATVWLYLPDGVPAGEYVTVIEFYTGGWTSKVASLTIWEDERPYISNFNPSPAEYYFSDTALTTGQWHRLELKIVVSDTTGRAELWQDGVKKVDEYNRDFGTGNIDHTLEAIFWKAAGTLPETLYIDNSFDRVWVDPEPTTGLGLEQNSTCPPTATPTPTNTPVPPTSTPTPTATGAPAAGKMYWTDAGADVIQRADLDGSNVETLVNTGLLYPYGIALDTAAGKMYWVDQSTDMIKRANLDGSNIENLITSGLTSTEFIALDVAAGKMYWTDSGTDMIQRANLDGTNIENLITIGLSLPEGIELDVASGKMYWADALDATIERANLDGSGAEILVTGVTQANGIALDLVAGKIYWVQDSGNLIQRANLDGTTVENITPAGTDNPKSIALDVAAGKMYWTESGIAGERIRRANLNGTGTEVLVTGLVNVRGIALDP
ncbi:MAG: DUF2341 domain-containing protein, partial [Anaerolineales bacterium]